MGGGEGSKFRVEGIERAELPVVEDGATELVLGEGSSEASSPLPSLCARVRACVCSLG